MGAEDSAMLNEKFLSVNGRICYYLINNVIERSKEGSFCAVHSREPVGRACTNGPDLSLLGPFYNTYRLKV